MTSTNVYIIAEAGVNHNGSADMAFQLIDAAVEADADAVKFQTFKAKNLITRSADKAEYQKKMTSESETQFKMLRKLELSNDLHYDLIEYCKKKNIEFLSTAFDLESLDFLSGTLKLKTLKIPKSESGNNDRVKCHHTLEKGKNKGRYCKNSKSQGNYCHLHTSKH